MPGLDGEISHTWWKALSLIRILLWPNDSRTNVHFFTSARYSAAITLFRYCNLHCSPVKEHVVNPEEVTAEMFRVLKPDGYLIAAVPFLQPEHKARPIFNDTPAMDWQR